MGERGKAEGEDFGCCVREGAAKRLLIPRGFALAGVKLFFFFSSFAFLFFAKGNQGDQGNQGSFSLCEWIEVMGFLFLLSLSWHDPEKEIK